MNKLTKQEKQENNKKTTVLKAAIKIIPMIYHCAPWLFIISIISSTFHGVSFGVITMFEQRFFDKATDFAMGKVMMSAVIFSLLSLGTVHVISQVLNGFCNFIPVIMADKCQGMLSYEIHKKISKLSPIVFENTENLDDIEKANLGKSNALWFAMTILSIFTFYTPYFTFMGWYLFRLKPILAWAILIVFVPTALTQIVRTKVFSKLEDKSAPIRRENSYYASCMVDREYFKETRLLGGFHYFKKLYLDTLKILNQLSFKANVKTNLIELSMKILTVLGYSGILYMLFDALMKKEISVGAFAAVFSSIGMLYGIMEEVVCRHIGSLAKNLGTIKNYLSFLDMEERKGEDIDIPADCDITLENVTFCYPQTEKNAISNVNFTIKNGETLAIVGENGSGKSTIVRLITGLYTPTEGKVKYGKIEPQKISFAKLFKNTSAVFQKYNRYQMKLSENIKISDINKEMNEKELDKICSDAGFSKENESFPDGYDTMLSREFDGVDLSGGEWQRVAIARAFYRINNFIILDEPTAAIDPFEETKIYNRFAKLAKDKTAIIVTHRLGSVKLADRIVVMKDGEIAEIGTHHELLENNGEYTRMYQSQQQWYEENEAVTI